MSGAPKAYHCLHLDLPKAKCVLCGRCLEVCPLFNATGREELSPKAKFFLAQSLLDQSPDLAAKAALELAGKCLSCGKCEKACPLSLCVPDLLSNLRAVSPGLEARLWHTWVSGAGVIWPLMVTMSRLSPRFALPGRLGGLISGLRAMDHRSALTPWLKPVAFEACGQGRKAVIFPGCVAAHVQTAWTRTATGLLSGLGFAVLPQPDFACCGCTLGHAGLKAAQREMQLKNVAGWRQAGRPLLLTFCATCRCGLRGYASRDLGWGSGEQELWLEALPSFAELALAVTFEPGQGAPAKVHYHRPCHGAGANKDQEFLAKALGERLSARTKKDLCCGFGGALKLSAPELSDQVAKGCLEFYNPAPGEQILTGCSGCVIQLRANAPAGVGVGHWLEVIDI